MMILLRDWQKDAYEAFKKNNFRGILKVGTGKGKTVFAIYVILQFLKENNNFKTCIIVPTINLMFQWKKELIKFLDINESEISLYYGQEKNTTGKIVIFVINSAVINSNLKKANLIKSFDFMIADECHHYGSNLFSKLFEIHTNKTLGLSATPERERDKEGTEKIIKGLGTKVFELNHLDDPKAIPNFVVWSILVRLTKEEENKYEEASFEILKLNKYFSEKLGINPENEDYINKIKELADKKNPLALKMLSLWSKRKGIIYCAENKLNLLKELVHMENESKVIIFNESINFTEKMYRELNKEYLQELFMIHSGLPKKEVQDRLNEFKDSKKGVLIAPKLIDEGYDVPDASVAIVVSFTRSARQMIQRDGRILRKTIEKQVATRYSLVIEGIEEEKYFEVLRNSEIGGKALEGEWLKYDSANNTFSEAVDFKQGFLHFDKIKQYHKDQFKEWITKQLDYYENNLKKNRIEEVEKRLDFFTRFSDVLEYLSKEFPERWINLREKIKIKEGKRVRIFLSKTKRKLLMNQLMRIDSQLGLPNSVYKIIRGLIQTEPGIFDNESKEYIINLTTGEQPQIWPTELWAFLKDYVLPKIKQ